MLGVLLRSTAIWFAILGLAIANGAVRQSILIPRMGDAKGHIVSVLLLSSIVFVVTWLTIGWIRPQSARASWIIGAYWVALTVAFEFLAGHFLFGVPWPTLLADYNVMNGRIWPLVLLVTFIAPAVAGRLRL